jgi:hypothetical protein
MVNCCLCENQAEIHGQDYGRRKITRCPSCGYYEITNVAIFKIQAADFPENAKYQLIKQVKQINDSGGEALIVFEDNTLKVLNKGNLSS